MRKVIADLTVSYRAGRNQDPLLVRVRELLIRGGVKLDSGGKPSSRPPMELHMLDFCNQVHIRSYAYEALWAGLNGRRAIRRSSAWPEVVSAVRSLEAPLEALPNDHVLRADIEHDLNWWHTRCREWIGDGEMMVRYQTTEEAAQTINRTPEQFRVWASRKHIKSMGHISLGKTRVSVWDMEEVLVADRINA